MKTSSKTLDQEKVYKWKATCDTCDTDYFSRNEVDNKRSCSKCSKDKYDSKSNLKYKENKSIKTYEQFIYK